MRMLKFKECSMDSPTKSLFGQHCWPSCPVNSRVRELKKANSFNLRVRRKKIRKNWIQKKTLNLTIRVKEKHREEDCKRMV